jgi:hypothetical protein
LRAAERDESIIDSWHEGKADRPDDQPDAGPDDDVDDVDDERVEDEPDLLPSPRSPSPVRRGAKRRSLLRRPIGRRRSSRPTRPSLTNPTGGRSVVETSHSASGILLGAVVYALVLSVVNYGASGPGLWFKAKFLNIPAGSSSSTAGGPSSPDHAQTGTPKL